MKRLVKYIAIFCLVLLTIVSCSTKKNTSITRQWHAFTGRYNTYYNGTVAYIDASLEKEKGNKDNFTERLPLYTVGNKASRDLGKANYDVAITKSQKTIQLHSIKAKPEWNKNRRKTQKDIEWLSRKEYNPFIWRAWMLMGRSQFYKGEFEEAAATFAYMSRLYKGQPAIYGKARAWLAKCFIENNFLYDAEDVIRNMQRDSINWRAQKEWDYTLCDYYLHTEELDKAAEYLRKVIKHEMRSKQRAREYYLLGQIEGSMGHKQEAYEAFKKVLRQSPPYELAFNARISMTEVMAQGQAKKMISRLKRMARNRNNSEYLDQVYYAIGNIYLAEKDTANAISAYETGNEKATRAGIEKGVLLLHLGDLYWTKEKYGDARRCYGEAIGLLDKDRPDYEQLSNRSKVLDELVPYTDAIELQDSLLELSVMDEDSRNAAIDRVIEELRKKEKEQEATEAEEKVAQLQQKYSNNSNLNKNTTPTMPVMNRGGSTTWYFYNPQAVLQGKQSFQRLWGKRENVDDWRRYNKTVVEDVFETDSLEMMTDEQRDSVAAVEEAQQKEEERLDSAVNDPHKREYYLAQIPFSDEAKAAAHEVIKEGLYNSGIIFKDKLDNLPLSQKQFDRLMRDYPDYSPKDELYYHLFLLYSREDDSATAQSYVDSLSQYYPDSKWTTLLTDPYFADNARFGKELEDSLYGATYDAFRGERFKEVYDNAEVSGKRFPLGDNRDRFIFIEGLTKLNDGNPDGCLEAMQLVVKEYPQSKVSEMAGMIINGVKAGRQLRSAGFDLANMWDRRNITLNEGDSMAEAGLSKDRDTEFAFLFAYAPDSLDENRLLFQMARYNFTNFLVRNFNISIEDSYGMHHMIVDGFRNFDEARQYSRLLLQQESIKRASQKARPIVISHENLLLINGRYSYNDYDSFYVANFAPLPPVNAEKLYEPLPVEVKEKKSDAPVDEREAERNAMKEEEKDPVKPMLPTEDVAPGLALPVEPKKEDELEENDANTIIAPAETEIAIPTEEAPATPATEQMEVTVPAENTAPVTPATEQMEVTVPAENTAPVTPATEQMEITVPTETTPTTPATEQMEIAVPTETTPTTPATEEMEITVPTEAAPTTPETQDEFIIEDNGTQTQPTEDVETIEIVDTPAETPVQEEEGFIIEDDNDDKKKKSTRDLEDEYFELDGF